MPDATEAPVEGVSVTIDGTVVSARRGELIIDAAERHGVYIPRFCYHPRMKPVGMCRMCLVEVDTGRGPALQPSCMLECTPDMVVETESEVAKKAQEGVLEFLLINHPLDCPVCDKGGECPLQDQTMSHGPGESRHVEEKRHKAKPIPISDLVHLDRERCILCDRCTRFASEVAGDPLITFINRGNDTEVNTFPDEPFASYFSGNTVQICPVGALLATPYRFKARPWDLVQAESTCTTCSVGCRITVDSSRNEVLRYHGVDVDPVNWGWLCDKGRFGYEALDGEGRLVEPHVRGADGTLAPARWAVALDAAAAALRDAVEADGPDAIGVLGGARLTNEDAYAWAKLAKGVLGTDNVDAQLDDGLPAAAVVGLPRATIDDVCRPGGTVVLLAPDLKEELPVLYLRLRHAIVEDGATVIEVAPRSGGLSHLVAASLAYRPGEMAEVVRALVGEAGQGKDAGGVDPQALASARSLLAAADGPVTVVVGRPSLAESADFAVDAAATLLRARPDTRFLPVLRRGNVHGAIDMGLAPGLLPGRVDLDGARGWFATVWPGVPARPGLDARGILTAAAEGRLRTLVLLGVDPLADFPDRDLARRALDSGVTVVATDLYLTESSSRAHVVLPAAGATEVDGTTTNVEGRVSALRRRVTPPGTARSDWMLAAELAFRLGADLGATSPEELWAEIERVAPAHAGITAELLASPEAADGIVVPLPDLAAVDREAAAGEEGPEHAGEAASAPVAAEAVVEADTTAEAQAADAAATEAAAEEVAEDGTIAEGATADGPAPAGPAHPPLVRLGEVPAAPLAPLDAYGVRLVATRKLYDLGVTVQRSPHLAGMAAEAPLALHPSDFGRLGVQEGDQVRVTTSRGSATLRVVRDEGVPRGAAAAVVNQPGVDVMALLDPSEPVTTLRVDTGGAS
jgi:NADH-quinone oxidoreductase subunit G